MFETHEIINDQENQNWAEQRNMNKMKQNIKVPKRDNNGVMNASFWLVDEYSVSYYFQVNPVKVVP